MLDLQEGRVKVLGAVAEEIERGHQQDRIDASHCEKNVASVRHWTAAHRTGTDFSGGAGLPTVCYTRTPNIRCDWGLGSLLGTTTMRIGALSGWTGEQRHVVAACFLGWILDAFDFFLLVFVLKDIAQEFNTQITEVTFAILLTLAMRPVGAYLFGRAADRWGRRPTLMVNILLYSFIEFASGFAPSLAVLLMLRAIFGIAMGGEWGVGASLTMESIPPHARGFVSGLLQSGYPTGYFLASIVYGVLFQYIIWPA